jgi:PleD family two-component response regulator
MKTILVVDDEPKIVRLVRDYLERAGFEVRSASDGKSALDLAHTEKPDLIVLDLGLPKMDGLDVTRELRKTSAAPIIMLTARSEETDKLIGLELGADDYITKPFDIEELKLRVQGAIRRSEREALTDPRSGLPAGRLIEEQLRTTIRKTGWAYMDIRINFFDQFKDVYGFVAADDVLRFAAMVMSEVVDELGSASDFIGHAGGDNFVIIGSEDAAEKIRARLKARFAEEVQTHYNFMDRQQGFIMAPNAEGQNEKTPLMSFSIGIVTPKQQSFADIREITELAADVRRQDSPQPAVKG